MGLQFGGRTTSQPHHHQTGELHYMRLRHAVDTPKKGFM